MLRQHLQIFAQPISPMNVLIKQARIVAPHSGNHGRIADIFIEDGIIRKIEDTITVENTKVLQAENLHVSIGWMDVFANFSDPGLEQNESIDTGAASAAAGGFTHVMLVPNTSPVISAKAQVEYILKKAEGHSVSIYPIGAVTQNAKGSNLAEMYDMHNSGCIAFSDGIHPLQNPGILLKALQYVTAIDKTIIQMPCNTSMGNHGLMNEGLVSTRLGLPGIPAIAEELMIHQCIQLLQYTGSKLHLTGVSTQKGIEQITDAKKMGLHISFSVTPYHGYFCDEDLSNYDTNLKLDPPLRTSADKEAIRNAISGGIVDCIASHHFPLHSDYKDCEFENAQCGMIGLQSVFGAIHSIHTNLEILIRQLTIAPRKIFGLSIPLPEPGANACFTLFNPAKEYIFEKEMLVSKSANTAFAGQKLKGEVLGIINNNKIYWQNDFIQ